MTSPNALQRLLAQEQLFDRKLGDLWVLARERANGVSSPTLVDAVDGLARAFLDHQEAERRLAATTDGQLLEHKGSLSAHRLRVSLLLDEAQEVSASPVITETERAEALLLIIARLFTLTRWKERELIWELMGRPSYITDGYSG